MKILQVIQRFPPAVGGGEEVVFQLCRALVRRGHEITVVTSNWLYDADIPGVSFSRINFAFPKHPLASEEYMDGVDIRRFRPWVRFWSYAMNPELIAFLIRYSSDYDIIHAHHYMFVESDIAALVSALRHKPFVLTHHRGLEAVDNVGLPYRFARSLYNGTIGKLTLGAVNKLIVLTEIMKKEFERIGVPQESLRVIPNGVDFHRFRPKSISEDLMRSLGNPERIVLFVGRLEKVKGPQYLIEAAPAIRKYYPDTKFVFIGEDWGYGRFLHELGEKLTVEKDLFFAGRVDDDQMADFYNIADVLVFPSIGEGFGLVVAECMACGTPAVFADSDGLKYILSQIGGHGLDMEENVVAQIIQAVNNIFANPNIKKDLDRKRKMLKRILDWSVIARKTEEVYLEALEK
ncbi:MAG: glycosyltransferase family 4 protein [Methanotrichaceae archaeon]|nr:glycosyltransferase family 4 protein [Methanotrichaceae archaeon]